MVSHKAIDILSGPWEQWQCFEPFNNWLIVIITLWYYSTSIVDYKCNVLYKTGPIQCTFNQHYGYWWSGALAPGHQYPQCWVNIILVEVIYWGSNQGQGRALSYYSDLTLSQEFQPMAAQLSMKAALPLAKILATASCRSSKTGPSIGLVMAWCHQLRSLWNRWNIQQLFMIGNTSFHWSMSCYSACYISHSKAITFIRMVFILTKIQINPVEKPTTHLPRPLKM